MIQIIKNTESKVYLTLNENQITGGDRILVIYNGNISIHTEPLENDLSPNPNRYNEYAITLDLNAGEYSYEVIEDVDTLLESGLLRVIDPNNNQVDIIYPDQNNGNDIYF